jgi:UDP-glucose 4-epimerase
MKILITGGAGYIGGRLVETLQHLRKVDEIIVYDNLASKRHNFFLSKEFRCKKLKFIDADILDSRALAKAMKGVDVVYHLAACVSMPFVNFAAHQFEQTNRWGTAELSYCIEAEASVKKVIYLSSSSVYGFADMPSTEQETPNPVSFYGLSKYESEAYLSRLATADREVYVLRCGNVFGYARAMRFDTIVNNLAFDAKYKGKVIVEGKGEQRYSLVTICSINDVLAAFLNDKANYLKSGTYNVVEWNMSVMEVIEHLKTFFPDLDTIFVSQNVPFRHVQAAANSAIQPLFETSPTRFDEALEQLINHFV